VAEHPEHAPEHALLVCPHQLVERSFVAPLEALDQLFFVAFGHGNVKARGCCGSVLELRERSCTLHGKPSLLSMTTRGPRGSRQCTGGAPFPTSTDRVRVPRACGAWS